jgi:transcriptional pleiotropic regulator of transition state genes
MIRLGERDYQEKGSWEMKSIGIVRRVDELGRIVLPSELRKTLNIEERDSLEIFTDDDKIILKKYQPSDIFTGEMEDLIDFRGKKISKKTIVELAKLAGLRVEK